MIPSDTLLLFRFIFFTRDFISSLVSVSLLSSSQWIMRMYGVSGVFFDANKSSTIPMKMLPKTASGTSPAASTIPTAMLQKRNSMSTGSFIAARNLTMESAPTMPRDRTTLLATVMISMVVIRARPMSVTPKPGEYMTPLYVFL